MSLFFNKVADKNTLSDTFVVPTKSLSTHTENLVMTVLQYYL